MSDFAKEVRELFSDAEAADKTNRDEALKDLEFAAGEHWDAEVRKYREQMGIAKYGFPLPCLTINDLPQKAAQVIGDRKANATSIKFLPREDGDREIASIRGELVRSIELQSKAERAYHKAFKSAVNCGIGNFRVDLDYAYDDAFERDLFIRSIPNPFAVVWDETAADETGRDAKFCFVTDRLRRKEYKALYPKAAETDAFDAETKTAGWVEEGGEFVRVCEYWKVEERPRTIAMMSDGSVKDVTDLLANDWLPFAAMRGDGQPIVREKALCKYAVMVLTNGQEELTDPFELKIPRVPIIRVSGLETWVGDRRVRHGIVRFARDPAMLRDYWRSVIAEKLMLAPRANFMAETEAVKGREQDWPNTLVYNKGAPPPVPITQNDLAAMMNEAQMCAQDMKDVTGLHDATLGMKSNETSGIAIQRRQHEGDIATIEYHSNMNAAMQEAGEVLNALIPVVYDTARTIRTVGEDEAVKLIRINDPNDPEAIDLGKGRYDVTVSTGPAYMTKRQEASTSMMEAARVAPQLFEVAGDLMAKAQDWPGADQIAERLKRAIPQQLLGADEQNDDEDPEAAAEAAAKAQQAEQVQQQMAGLEMAIKQAEADEAEAKARLADAQARKATAEAMEIEAGLTLKGAALAEQAVNDDAEELTLDIPPEMPSQPGGVE